MLTPINKYARELNLEYWKLTERLIDQYCQLRLHNPFKEFPEVAKAIHRAGVLTELWASVALKLGGRR